jgi:hypothetical protein
MKRVVCSYGNPKYYKSLDLLEKTALEVGKVDLFIRYTREWLETTEFYKKNKYILDMPRGNGYWIWKPFIILETFQGLEDGDVVLYSDAGLSVIDNLTPLFDVTRDNKNDGKTIFKLPPVGVDAHIAKTWTKRDCFVLTGSDEPKYWNANMTNGAVSLWQKNAANIDFLKEWLRYLRNIQIVTDSPNMAGTNFIEFKDHRHDQSVLTILSVKYDLELFRDPTQFGNDFKDEFTNSPYGQLFNHNRGNISA